MQGHVECEGPNNQLYKFHGNIKVGDDQLVPIEAEEILLRGARLRNTTHVQGTVAELNKFQLTKYVGNVQTCANQDSLHKAENYAYIFELVA